MVATKPPKVVKYSYAERVLHAFPQAQKDHRRHSVHIATLRAQVRKLADERKDKLGPRWRAWVGKAVHKLEEQGLLEQQDSTGHVSMTPEGKKLIAQARKNLPEDAAVKAIVSHYGTPGKSPRKRAASRRSFAPTDADEGDDEYMPATAPSRRISGTPASKRRRVTIGGATPGMSASHDTPSKPISKMNKNELKAEIRALQRLRLQHSTPSHRSHAAASEGPEDSPADSVSGNLTTRLREAVAMKESELRKMQHELFVVRATQTPASRVPASSRNTPDTSLPRLPLARFGVTRTQSGSIIPDISMRPTPAPSDHEEVHVHERAESELTDLDDIQDLYAAQDMDDGADFGEGADQTENDDRAEDVFPQLLPSKTVPTDRQVATPASSAHNEETEDDVSERLKKTEIRVSELQRETTKLQSIIQNRDTRIAQLTSDIEAQRATNVVELEKVTEERDQLLEKQSSLVKELATEQARSQGLESGRQRLIKEIGSLSSAIAKAEEEKKAAEDRAIDLSCELETDRAALESVRAELESVTGERDTFVVDLTAASASLGQARAELTSEHEQTTALANQLDSMRGDLTVVSVDLVTRTSELTAERETAEARKNELDSTRQDLIHALEQLNRTKSGLDTATAKLDSAEAQLIRTAEELAVRDEELVRTSGDLESTSEALVSVQSELETKAAALAAAEEDLSSTRASLKALQTENTTLLSDRAALQAIAQQTADELSAQAQAHEQAVALLQSDIESLRSAKDELEAGLQEQIESLEAERAKDRAKIENLKEGYVRLRALQMNALQDIEEQIASVSSPNSDKAMLFSNGAATPRTSDSATSPGRSPSYTRLTRDGRSAETIAGGDTFSGLLAGALPWPATA